MKILFNQKGQALLFITTLLMILCLLGIASLNLVKTEKLVVNDSVEEIQAYYVAEAAVEKVLALLKENSEILERSEFDKKPYLGKTELSNLKNSLDAQNLATVEQLLELFNHPYAALEIYQANGESFIPTKNTRAGTLHAISLAKTPDKTLTNSSDCTLRIEATGKYGLATRTLVVHVRVARPFKAINGVVVENLPNFTRYSEFDSPLTILRGGEINPKGYFMQSISIDGDCSLREDTNLLAQAPLIVKGNVDISSGAQVEGLVQATGGVLLEEGVVGNPVVNEHLVLNLTFPDFPEIDSARLQKNCDYYYSGDQILRTEDLQTGIHFVEGNVILNGNYRGHITLAASGSITLPHSALVQSQVPQEDSLFLLGFGGVQVEDQAQLTALVYTPTAMELGYQAQFSGVLACRNLYSNGAIFIENTVIKQVHPTWHITQIKILSWQEKYPVFRIN